MTTVLVAGSARCAAACYDATGHECMCLCGGVNHGVGLVRALAQTPELVDGATGQTLVAVLALPLGLVVEPEPTPQPAHEEDRPMPAKIDLRSPYTPDEWVAIGAALKAERGRRAKHDAPFTQADQLAVAHAAVRPMREAALTAEAR